MQLRWRICVWHDSFGELHGETGDFSDAGVYIRLAELTRLPLGTQLTGQIQDLPAEAPVLAMEIRWVDEQGAGLRFLL